MALCRRHLNRLCIAFFCSLVNHVYLAKRSQLPNSTARIHSVKRERDQAPNAQRAFVPSNVNQSQQIYPKISRLLIRCNSDDILKLGDWFLQHVWFLLTSMVIREFQELPCNIERKHDIFHRFWSLSMTLNKNKTRH